MKGWPRLPSPEFDISPDQGPRSNRFNDGYASPAGAAAETQLVFLGGIGAPEIWRGRQDFAIGETGFGLGLNFLMTWAAWRETAPPGARLHYVSVEGYPLDRSALPRAHDLYRQVPGLQPLIDALCAAFPIPHAGFHRLSLEGGKVQLTLLFGAVEDTLSTLQGKMDAWYLDGFAPARNPDMWSPDVFAEIARHTKPGGRIATYTAAGHVRRGLEETGFAMQKHKGYAHKRERLTGTLTHSPDPIKSTDPWFDLPDTPRDPGQTAIIGGGIGATCLWRALKARGIKARIFDRAGADGGMGGNPAAMIAPKLPAGASLSGRLNALAFLKALAFYDDLPPDVWQGPRGILQTATDAEDAKRQERLVEALGWPGNVIGISDAPGRQALSFPTSGCLDPKAVQRSIGAPIETAEVRTLEGDDGAWRLLDGAGSEIWSGQTVVAAAGGWTGRLLQAPWLGIRPSRGQVSWVGQGGLPDTLPRQGLSFGGYLTPEITLPHGGKGRVLGSSFDAWRDPDGNPTWREWSMPDHERYATEFANLFDLPIPSSDTGWTGLRAMTADRLPVVGPMPDPEAYAQDYPDLHHGKYWVDYPPARYRDGLYVLSGFGARGYQFAPLMADLLTDMIARAPLPLERDLVAAVHPARFLIRDLKRAGGGTI